MPIGVGAGLLIGGLASGAGSVASGLVGAHAAGKAADAQAQAAEEAAQLQHEDAQAALQFQEQEFAQQQANLAPWLQSGASGLVNLDSLMGILPSTFSSTAVPMPWNPNNTNATSGVNPWANPSAQLTTPIEEPGGRPINVMADQQDANSTFNLPGGIHSVGGPNGPPVRRIGSVGVDPVFANPQDFSGVPVNEGMATDAVGNQAQFGDANQPNLNTSAAGGFPGPLNPGSLSPGQNSTPLSSLVNPSLGAPGSLMAQWGFQFAPPTDVTEQNDPGFQFRLQQGQQALENSAAARGGLLSGGTAKALERYAQDYSSNEYQNVFNRSLTEYQQAYNQFQQAQANQFNRLAAISGVGQTAAQQLNTAGATAANNVGNILLGSGQQIGQDIQNAGAARASGYLGAGNAYSNMFNSLGSLGGLFSTYNNLKNS